ncbi:HNH endonuclease [Pusillimonas sp. ANT_WB101]|nr:HNH endonuclease [Pusillimonas sp. ANT_WB101]
MKYTPKKDNGRTLLLGSAAWHRLRDVVLSRDPMCVHCLARGIHTPARDVDHIDNEPSNNDLDNLQGLCGPCHSRKTAADMGKRVAYGCDVLGNPLDPDHHWNK